jgi:hypothetical protein
LQRRAPVAGSAAGRDGCAVSEQNRWEAVLVAGYLGWFGLIGLRTWV